MVGMAALQTVTLTILVFPSSLCETAIVLAVSEGYYCDIWVSRVAGQLEGNMGEMLEGEADSSREMWRVLIQWAAFNSLSIVKYSKKLNDGLSCVK